MSDAIQQNIRCPRCGQEAPFTIWRAINVTLNPDEKQSLITGELFRFTCGGCDAVTQVVYPMLYHDMQRRLMVWMIPDDDSGRPGEPDGPAIDVQSGAMAGYTARVVSTVNELLEKIMIFDAELDDLTLEMVKIVIATQLEASGQPKDAKIHFAHVQSDEAGTGAGAGAGGQEQLVFAVVTPTGTRAAALPREPIYSNMRKAAQELSNRSPAALHGKWPRVDGAYLMRLMDQSLGT